MAKKIGCSKLKRMLKLKDKVAAPREAAEETSYMCTDAFRINHLLKPPYNIIIDTNFVNTCIRKKLDLHTGLLDCLLGNTALFVTECVIGELEKLGRIYRVALALVKEKSFSRLECDHRGTYADDCILRRVNVNRSYIVATCDAELKQRIRKVQGVPILCIRGKRFVVEKLSNAPTNA